MHSDHFNISGKADSFVIALKSVSQKERDKPVSHVFANDYNNLLSLFLKAYPEKSEFAPPKIENTEFRAMDRVSVNYVDILTFAEQIKKLLDDIYTADSD